MEDPNEIQIVDATAMEVIARAEIDSQVATAKQYPRSISQAKDKFLAIAGCDPETAESMFYRLPRAGKSIEGEGIRAAEVIVNSWGNIAAQTIIIDNGTAKDAKFVKVKGMCRDLESNVSGSMEVEIRITNKDGKKYNDDMIQTTLKAASAKAYRDAVFKVVPKAVFKKEFDQIKKIARGEEQDFTSRLENVQKFFNSRSNGKLKEKEIVALVNIGRDEFDNIAKGIEDFTLDDVLHLRMIANAVNDGSMTIQSLLDEIQNKGNNGELELGRKSTKKQQPASSNTEKKDDPPAPSEKNDLKNWISDALKYEPQKLEAVVKDFCATHDKESYNQLTIAQLKELKEIINATLNGKGNDE